MGAVRGLSLLLSQPIRNSPLEEHTSPVPQGPTDGLGRITCFFGEKPKKKQKQLKRKLFWFRIPLRRNSAFSAEKVTKALLVQGSFEEKFSLLGRESARSTYHYQRNSIMKVEISNCYGFEKCRKGIEKGRPIFKAANPKNN